MQVVIRDNFYDLVGTGDLSLEDVYTLVDDIEWHNQMCIVSSGYRRPGCITITIDRDDAPIVKKHAEDGEIAITINDQYEFIIEDDIELEEDDPQQCLEV